jgi:hypothetical protein
MSGADARHRQRGGVRAGVREMLERDDERERRSRLLLRDEAERSAGTSADGHPAADMETGDSAGQRLVPNAR